MATQPGQVPTASSSGLIASPIHTLLVIILVALNAYRSFTIAAKAHSGTAINRPNMYLRTIVVELVFLAIVVIGVRLRGARLQSLFGQRWKSIGEIMRDLGLGVFLLVTSTALVSIIGGLHHRASPDQGISYLIPRTATELYLWLLLSLTAGICEEALFRGYFQVQFTAFSRSVPLGIALSAVAFGAVHVYQGLGRATVIAISALLYGSFAYWRGTVRPGMIAHSLQDAVAPLLLKLARH